MPLVPKSASVTGKRPSGGHSASPVPRQSDTVTYRTRLACFLCPASLTRSHIGQLVFPCPASLNGRVSDTACFPVPRQSDTVTYRTQLVCFPCPVSLTRSHRTPCFPVPRQSDTVTHRTHLVCFPCSASLTRSHIGHSLFSRAPPV